MAQRQNILVLWLADPALDAPVVGWSRWNGADAEDHWAGDEQTPPYRNAVAALRDGWRLFQASPLLPHIPETETQTAYLKYEYWFEQIIDV